MGDVMKSQKPKVYKLRGSARSPDTRGTRRANRFPARRAFRVGGDILIRPGRTVPLAAHALERHIEEILKRVKEGVLVVLDAGKPMTLDELKAVSGGETVSSQESDEDTDDDEFEFEEGYLRGVEGAVEKAPEAVEAEEPELVPGVELPEGWRRMNKDDLLEIFTLYEIPLPKVTNKSDLLEALENYEIRGSTRE